MLMKLQSISDLGSQQLVYKEVFLKEMLNDTLDNFRTALNKNNIHGFVEVDIKEPFISYPAMIRIIVENLVENAIHFCGVKDQFIKLRVLKQNAQLKLIVEDNGQGIDAEYHGRIFEMYFRANQNSKGNGLGLYIVKKAIEKLGGSISFESQLGMGTTFIILLPFEQKFTDFV
jgi:signal transduction histidine kinase